MAYDKKKKNLSMSDTSIEEANAEIEQLKKLLQQAKSVALSQEHLAATGRLTAGVAHEIKNPLNFINNFSKIANSTANDLAEELTEPDSIDWEEVEDLIDILQEATARVVEHGIRADAIVKSMLMHARGEEETKIDVDVENLIQDFTRLAQKGFGSEYPEGKIEVETSVSTDMPPLIVPAQGLSRVIINLVTNACYEAFKTAEKSNGPNSGQVSLDATYNSEKGLLVIRVEDTGGGVKPEVRDQIFEPFFTTKPTSEGTGLGLSICRGIIESNQGRLYVEDAELGGAAFVVEIPAETGVSI